MHKLAIHGGEPVRTKPFPSNLPGASVLGKEELQEVTDVIESRTPFRFYGIGSPTKVADFESQVCQKFGTRYALAVSSGTAALQCAIAAIGLGPGDEVIIPSFSWYSDYCALVSLGVLPVFADIGEDLNLSPEDFEKKITPRTKAVIVVHYQGTPAKIEQIVSIAHAHGIVVVEDCAQAFGGSYNGKYLGTIGDIATASFQTHKMITAGEGGLVFTNNEEYYIRAIRYHDLGFVRPFFVDKLTHPEKAEKKDAFAGLQLRMSELQGACLLAQFRKIDMILETCRKHHARLRKYMEKYPEFPVRFVEGDCCIAFVLMMRTQEEVQLLTKALGAEGIPCGPTSACCNLLANEPISNRGMVHPNLPPFAPGDIGENVKYQASEECLNTDGILNRFFAIGIGPTYSDDDVDDVICALDKVLTALF